MKNILLFLVDDQRFDTIAALGNPQIKTPNLDALVARGTAFTRAHIPGGTCGAICMPSRAMLHSGRTLFHLDGRGEEIPAAHTTLGEHFRAQGYETFGTGKWHNGRTAFARSFGAGDEIFFGGMDDHWNVPAYHFDPAGRYDARLPYCPDAYNSNRVAFRQADHIPSGVHSTDLFVDTAIGFLKDRQTGGAPFFLSVALMAPHDPRTMPEAFRKLYDPAAIDLPANFLPEHPIDTGHLRGRDEMLAAYPRDPDEIRRHIAEYYAMITHLDDAFGRLVAALEACGELENTVIVFAGDNGLALGQHGLMGKQDLYDHSVRVPLVFAGPGIPAGERRDGLACLYDVFPTLCDLTQTDVPASVEGQSLAESLLRGAEGPRSEILLAFSSSIRGLTDGRHKLVEYACGETQLFDLHEDPLEMRNLADDPRHRDTLADLRTRLLARSRAEEDTPHPATEEFWRARPDLKGRDVP